MTLNLKNWSENLKYKPLQPFSNPNNTQSAQSLFPNSKIQTLKQSYNIHWLERQKPYQYQLYEYKNEEIKWKLWTKSVFVIFWPKSGQNSGPKFPNMGIFIQNCIFSFNQKDWNHIKSNCDFNTEDLKWNPWK